MAKKKRSARQIADRILAEQVEHLETKWKTFQAGDSTSAMTDLEIRFLLDVKKLEQDADMQEAQTAYLEQLSDGDLEIFYQKLEASLPAPEDIE